MANSWNGPQLGSPIRTDVPELQKKLIALLKQDPTSVANIPSGAKRLVNTSGVQWQVQQYNGSSWAAIGKLMHDVDKLDGYHAAITPNANTVAVRNADKKLEGDITGNAATASSAATLSETLPVNKGGTGATTSAAARTNLGVPPTSHASSGTTYGLATDTNYGHVRSDKTTTNIRVGEVVVQDVAINGDFNDLASGRGQIGNPKLKGPDQDLNTYIISGTYFVNSSGTTPLPEFGVGGVIVVYRPTSTFIKQVFFTYNTNGTYVRHTLNGGDTWTDWIKLISKTDLATSSSTGIVKPGTGIGVDVSGSLSILPPVAAGSTEARTLPDRFADVVNVKDFGAKGDGKANDTVAFEKAASTGKSVFVPCGNYFLTKKVSGSFYSDNEVKILGTGNAFVDVIPKISLRLQAENTKKVSTISRNSTYIGQVYSPTGDESIGIQCSVQDLMPDPYDNNIIYVSWSSLDIDGYVTKYRWDGSKYAPISSSPSGNLSHQNSCLYKPTEQSLPHFFTYSTSPAKLHLKKWSEVDGENLETVKSWDVLPDIFEKTAGSVTRPGFNEVVWVGLCPVLSPDKRKILIRGVRKSDTKVCFLVFDVNKLIESTTEDATSLYEQMVVEPDWSKWSPEPKWDISRQSVAFDGYNIYCMDSHTGYSKHYIRVFDLSGNIVCDRPHTMEGLAQNVSLRSYEGESIIWGKNRYGYMSLQLMVMVADGMNEEDIDKRYAYIYDLSSGAADSRFLEFRDWYRPRTFVDADNIINFGRTETETNLAGESTDVARFPFYFKPHSYIGLTSNYIMVESIHDVLLKSGKGTSNEVAVRLLVDGTGYRTFCCDPISISATVNLGASNRQWKDIYASNSSIVTSDSREKQSIEPYPDAVLDAWGDVQFRQFFFNEAVEKKGIELARVHSGVIAQQVVSAFSARGLDATRYGLLCFDRWPDEYEDVEVIDAPAVFDADGYEVIPAQTHMEKKLVTKAGERYGIRYSEALCMEAAYQRRRADKLEQRIASIEEMLK